MPRVNPVSIGGGNEARQALTKFNVDKGVDLLSSGGDALAAFAEEDRRQRDTLKSIEVEGEYKRRVAQRVGELDPMATDYEQQVDEITSSEREALYGSAQLASPDIGDTLQQSMKKHGEISKTNAMLFRRAEMEKESVRVRTDLENEALDQIRSDPDGADAYIEAFGARVGSVNQGIRTPSELAKLQDSFRNRALYARAEGLALDERYDEARAYADAVGGDMDPKTHRALKRRIREIETQARSDARIDNETTVNNLKIAISDADDEGSLAALRERVEDEADQGLFEGNDSSRVSIITAIENKRDRLRRQSDNLASATSKYNSGIGFDTQKEADLVWNSIAPKMKGQPASVVVKHVKEFVAKGGIVPRPFKSMMTNAERVQDPGLLAVAARMHDEIKDRAPNADTGAGDRVALTSAYSEMSGLSYEEAARRVIDRVPDPAALKERKEQAKTVFKEFDARETMMNQGLASEGLLSTVTFGMLGSPDEIPAQAAQDYEAMVRLHYNLSGDKDLAIAAANKRFSQLYGMRGEANGAHSLVKHPPERFFPGATNEYLTQDQKSEIINNEVGGLLKQHGVVPGKTTDNEADEVLPPFRIVSNKQTEEALARGEPPVYEVWVRQSQGGVAVMVPLRAKNVAGQEVRVQYALPTMGELVKNPVYSKLVETERERARRPGPKRKEQTLDRWQQRIEDRENDVNARQRSIAEGLRPPSSLKEFRERFQKVMGGK